MKIIFWAGDSTVKQNSILTYPQTGIGQMLDRYLDRFHVVVSNHAENGRSTKSFFDEGRLAPIYDQITRGDFLFVQFGHNDEKEEDTARYADPDGEFCDNLERFANCARNKHAIPVFITPVSRRGFTNPDARYRHDRWAAAAKRMGEKLNVACIDLTAMSEELLIHTPDEVRDTWFMPDGTHLKPEGAMAFAGLIAKALYRLGGEYRALLAPEYVESLEAERSGQP